MTKQIEYREECFETIRECIKGRMPLKATIDECIKTYPMYILKRLENGIKKSKKRMRSKSGKIIILWICKIENRKRSLLKSDYFKMQKKIMKGITTYKMILKSFRT